MTIKHTHTFVFYEVRRGQRFFKCDDPNCTAFMPSRLIKDKVSICSKCRKNELILDKETLRRARPMCIECSNTKAAIAYRQAKAAVEEILKPQQHQIEGVKQ